MCLAIPGRIDAIDRSTGAATVDVLGVRREVNIDLIADEHPGVGDWVLIHVGFALSTIDADEAAEQLRVLDLLGTLPEARDEVLGYGSTHAPDAPRTPDDPPDARDPR